MAKRIGTCDCCDARDVTLRRQQVTGIETYACMVCDGESDPDELKEEISRLRRKAETGEQWAYLCQLDNQRENILHGIYAEKFGAH